MPLLSRESPCIGFCSTVYGDDVCRGCNRYFEEVIHWEKLSNVDKANAMERIHGILRAAVNEFLVIKDLDLLNQQLIKHQVPLPEIDSPEARVLAILYVGAPLMLDLRAYGLLTTEKSKDMTAQDIKLAIIQKRIVLAQPGYLPWKTKLQF